MTTRTPTAAQTAGPFRQRDPSPGAVLAVVGFSAFVADLGPAAAARSGA